MEKTVNLVGREKEKEVLIEALSTQESEMIAIIGRRRVGKTFLVRATYQDTIAFEITGLQDASLKEQLTNFSIQLQAAFGANATALPKPQNWLEAFHQLTVCLEKQDKPAPKPVIFLDELPWLASRKSGFLNGLSYFWNSWAVKQNVVVVICGSAASWMIQQVVHHKGGLHNRITRRINLMPFTLYETAQFLESKQVFLDEYQVIQLYMAMGGIPHYLKEIKNGKSAAQNIQNICFTNTGLLYDEFSKLYTALFENAEQHIRIIKALSKKWKGLTRAEIIIETGFTDGGGLTRLLEELENSGFIAAFTAFPKKQKDMIFRLTDEYSLFYLQFMETNKRVEDGFWQNLSQTQPYKNWTGYAFENICLKHISQIKKALQIAGIYSEAGSFYQKGNTEQKGIQIDLLIERKDKIINLFELKFYNEPYMMNKKEAMALREKVAIFKQLTNTKHQVFVSILSTFGIISNEHSIGLIHNELTMSDLFERK